MVYVLVGFYTLVVLAVLWAAAVAAWQAAQGSRLRGSRVNKEQGGEGDVGQGAG